jgi:anti-sigma factor RsiW
MNHPFESLVEYVDGSLAESERPVVEAHLDSCQQCRAEVRLARSARVALSSLADEPVPAGLGERAIEEAASGAAAAAPGTPRWYRVAGIAAAAAVVGLLAIALPRLSSNESNPPAAMLEADAGAAAPDSVGARSTDFNPESLGALVTSEFETASTALSQQDDPAAVRQCLRRAFPKLEGDAVLLIHARFEGTDAFIGVFETGAGESPEKRTAVAASVRHCELLSYATYTI